MYKDLLAPLNTIKKMENESGYTNSTVGAEPTSSIPK